MIKFDAWWLPDGETHLPEWMTVTNRRVDGRLTYQFHKYEAALRRLGGAHVRAIDVGAHVGLWSYWMARDFFHVEAFEPKAEHRACWLQNMAETGPGWGNARLYEAALGAARGAAALTTGPSSSGDTWVSSTRPGRLPGAGEGIPMLPLDEYRFKHVDLLKVDCEGYELFVLQGAEQTLRTWRPLVVVEQKPGHGAKFGIADDAGAEYLRTLGYETLDVLNGDYIMGVPRP